MGALQPGQALVFLVTHDSLWLAANFCASRSIAFQSRTCVNHLSQESGASGLKQS